MEGGAAAAAGDGGDGPRERRGLGEAAGPQQNHQRQPQSAAGRFPKHSYWLDLWLFVLVDLALFFFVYLLPWEAMWELAGGSANLEAGLQKPSGNKRS